MNKRDIERAHRRLEKRHMELFHQMEESDAARQKWAEETCPVKPGDLVHHNTDYPEDMLFMSGRVDSVAFGFRCKWIVYVRPELRSGKGYRKRPVVVYGVDEIKCYQRVNGCRA